MHSVCNDTKQYVQNFKKSSEASNVLYISYVDNYVNNRERESETE